MNRFVIINVTTVAASGLVGFSPDGDEHRKGDSGTHARDALGLFDSVNSERAPLRVPYSVSPSGIRLHLIIHVMRTMTPAYRPLVRP